MIPKPLASAIVVLVCVVFSVNFFAQFIIGAFEPDPLIYGIFGTIVGGALALSRNPPPPPPGPGEQPAARSGDGLR